MGPDRANAVVASIPLHEVVVLAEGLAFPESPVARRDGSVVVAELGSGWLTVVQPDGAIERVADLGGGVNGVAIGPDGLAYVCNNGIGLGRTRPVTPSIQRVDLSSGAIETIYDACGTTPLRGPCDLAFDASGGMWLTDFTAGEILYARADRDHIRRVITGHHSPNGIALTVKGEELYWAQTHTRQIHRRAVVSYGVIKESPGYSIHALLRYGTLDPAAIVASLGDAYELDGLALDSSGRVCAGTLVVGGVTVISPATGDIQNRTLPESLHDRAITNLCFGGVDAQTVYMTAGETGRLLSARWEVPGLREAFA